MVEFLRRSVEHLETPVCDHCRVEMVWYRAVRPFGETELIAHYFQCPNCNRILEIETKQKADGTDGPPSNVPRRKMLPPSMTAGASGPAAVA
jgi:hypothetical protein